MIFMPYSSTRLINKPSFDFTAVVMPGSIDAQGTVQSASSVATTSTEIRGAEAIVLTVIMMVMLL